MPLKLPWRPFTCFRQQCITRRSFNAAAAPRYARLQDTSESVKIVVPSSTLSKNTSSSSTETQKPREVRTFPKTAEGRRDAKAYRDSFFPLEHKKHKKRGRHNVKRQLFGKEQPQIPAYPYGEARLYKQSNRGLYGGKRIQYGHSVSEKNKIKTRKRWKVNVQNKTLYSAALKQGIKIRVAASVLRTIDKVGGLDNYIVGSSPARIKELGVMGWMLRYRIMTTPAMQKRFSSERERLSLPRNGIGMIGLEDVQAMAAKPALLSVQPPEAVSVEGKKEALQQAAEQAYEDALESGLTEQEASEKYDQVYEAGLERAGRITGYDSEISDYTKRLLIASTVAHPPLKETLA